METKIRNEVIPYPARQDITAEGILYHPQLDDVLLPEFSISESDDGITLEIDEIPDSVSQVGSSLVVGSRKIEVGQISTFIHDFTFAALSEQTDQTLARHFPVINDGEDHLTPDMIIESSNTERRVLEFATHRGAGHRGVLNYYNQKVEKYKRPLQNRKDRTGWDITLSCIAVGFNHLVSDLRLSQQTVDELVYRFRFACAVMGQIQVSYPILVPQTSDEVSAAERKGKESIELITQSFVHGRGRAPTVDCFPLGSFKYLEKFLEGEEDIEYLKRIFGSTFADALKEMSQQHIPQGMRREGALRKNFSEAIHKLEDLQETQHEAYKQQENPPPEDVRKSTIKFPPWITKEGKRNIDVTPNSEDLDGLSDDTVTARVWKSIFEDSFFSGSEGWQENVDRELAIAKNELQVEDSENLKQEFHRVKATLPTQDWINLAARGIEGKSLRQEDLVRKADAKSHQVLSPLTDTTSIEQCLEDNNWFHRYKTSSETNLYQNLDQLITSSLEISCENEGLSSAILETFKNYRNVNVVHWSCMIAQIATELAIASKQSCKKHQFILKKLPNFPVYLLIKTSRSGSHIFYSLATRASDVVSELNGDVFKDFERSGRWFLTEFNSVKLCKLENLIKLPMLIVGLLAYFQESEDKIVTKYSRPTLFTRKATTLSILVCLEDKATTEELITIQRYIQMEGFVSEPLLPKPQKMIEKLGVALRTKLQVFLYNRCLKSIRVISGSPFKRVSRDKEVSWRGCFAGALGMSCSPEQMVNSWYLGYLKNKDEDTEINMLSAMYEKIVKVEEKRPLSDANLLGGDPLNPEMHEFSGSFIKFMAKALDEEVSTTKGRNWKYEVTTQFYRTIGSISLDQLATLKASSKFDESWEEFEDARMKEYHRVKVIERISELVQEGHTYYTDTLGRCFRVVLTDGCMRVCLFKKAQHGGLREIYVLRLEERMIQFCIETLARKVNEAVGHETISVPSRKEEILDTHPVRAAKACGEGTLITVCSSNDARTWNQGHYTTKFAFLMCELLPKELHGIIWASCAIFRKKKMMLNLDFLNSIAKGRAQKEGFKKKLHDGFSGNADIPWIGKGKTYLVTETGMMQGILHLTSSLFHAAFQCAMRKLIKAKMKNLVNCKILIDVIEGSDDSAIIISGAVKSDDEERRFRLCAAACLIWVKKLCVYAGIYMSPKSTIGCLDVCEYNSEFRFARLMCRPTFKWVTASLNIPEVEKISDRQEAFSNLLTSVLEGGGTSSLCSILQLCQAWCHYLLLGMWSSCVFGPLVPHLLKGKNPDVGFFLLDCPVSAGILGFRHNLWRYARKTHLSQIYARTLDNKTLESFTLTSGGSLSKSHLIRWGDRKKLANIKTRTGMEADWRAETNEDPSVLYRPAMTNQEVKLLLSLKLDSPGVAESLSKGNVLGRVLASSVYILQRRCITVRRTRRKYTLAELMIEQGEDGRTLTIAEESALFGDIISLEKNEDLSQKYTHAHGVLIGRSREMRRAKVEVLSPEESYRAPPVKIMGDVFFGTTKSHMGQNMLARELGFLKESFPWIDPDPHTCLLQSPFENQADLKTFFEKLEQKTRKVRMIGAAVFTRMGQTTLENLIRFNFQKNFELVKTDIAEYESTNEDEKFCKHVVTMILSGPFTNERKETMLIDFLKSSDLMAPRKLLKKSRTNVLRVVRAWLEGHSRIEELVERSMDGICGAFTIRQKTSKDKRGVIQYRGVGVWTGRIDGTDCRIHIENGGPGEQLLKKVIISSDRNLSDFLSGLERLCKELKVINPRKAHEVSMSQSQILGSLVDFRLESKFSKAGAPLFLIPAQEGFLREMMDKSSVSLLVRGDVLNIRADLGDGRLITMLSYKASGQDADTEQGQTFFKRRTVLKNTLPWAEREPYLSWISLNPIPDILVSRLREEMEGKRRSEGLDGTLLKDIYQRCCKSSLRRKGLTVGQYSGLRLKMEDQQDNVDIDLLQLLDEDVDFEDAMAGASLDDMENSVEDMEVLFGEEDLEIFDFTEIMSRSDPLAYHGFCDRIIEDFIRKLGHETIRKAIQKRQVLQTDYSLVKCLFESIGENPEELSIVVDADNEYASSSLLSEDIWG
ncbi:RNA-dependent RNA polymerase [Kismaayo virus]|uniref:RNA-directed RNA polymerase L n=1 Tax=Kismaayo virus TaxID=2847813 RepID=A0A097SRV3_9VIRU|nr:RNA-dependent RNA polymerase [Kismaayo virus]AIU95033.1 RNA-dependent RNA polymerase [Kismaayo virus]